MPPASVPPAGLSAAPQLTLALAIEALATALHRESGDIVSLLGVAHPLPASVISPKNQPHLQIDQAAAFCKNKPSGDPFGDLYQKFVPRSLRLARGEFYTPYNLAQWLCRRLEYLCTRSSQVTRKGQNSSDALLSPTLFPSVLDPACGSGVFLVATLRQRIDAGCPCDQWLNGLVGFDVNPLAVLLARASLLLTFMLACPEAEREGQWQRLLGQAEQRGASPFSVYLFDSVANRMPQATTPAHEIFAPCYPSLCPPRNRLEHASFDRIIGNPPWINWDRLDDERKEATLALWRHYGLFSLSGRAARFGGAKKEFASLLLYAVVDRYLRPGGQLGLLLPLTLFQTRESGQGFRRFRIPDPACPLGVHEIHDFSAISFFPGVASRLAALFLTKAEETYYPIPWFSWHWREDVVKRRHASTCDLDNDLLAEQGAVIQEQPEQQGSPLVRVTDTPFKTPRMRGSDQISSSHYVAQLGCNTGGANGVFWLERTGLETQEVLWQVRNRVACGKSKLETRTSWLESDLIYPLLRWSGVRAFHVQPEGWILLPQDAEKRRGLAEDLLRHRYPHCYDYLLLFEEFLRTRAIYRKLQSRQTFWSLYNVSSATLAPIKVVWRRMDSKLRAALVLPDQVSGKPIIPQETLSLVPVESVAEGDYLTALLNSAEIAETIALFGQEGTKGFGSPGMLTRLNIPRYDPNCSRHRELAEYGQRQRLTPLDGAPE
ncbi:MAG: N-6 DNA methylase [Planctomycetia bacterium]|nr:N-6 DNA methylase [Planctomycetia bacterium]